MSLLTMHPPTLPSAGRPPYVPPTHTTYDGVPSPDDDSHHERLVADVRDLLVRFRMRAWKDDVGVTSASWWLALNRRKLSLERELAQHRFLSKETGIPPAFMADFADPASLGREDGPIGTLLGLLDQLADALQEVEVQMEADNSYF